MSYLSAKLRKTPRIGRNLRSRQARPGFWRVFLFKFCVFITAGFTPSFPSVERISTAAIAHPNFVFRGRAEWVTAEYQIVHTCEFTI